jgi:hypothetical protein
VLDSWTCPGCTAWSLPEERRRRCRREPNADRVLKGTPHALDIGMARQQNLLRQMVQYSGIGEKLEKLGSSNGTAAKCVDVSPAAIRWGLPPWGLQLRCSDGCCAEILCASHPRRRCTVAHAAVGSLSAAGTHGAARSSRSSAPTRRTSNVLGRYHEVPVPPEQL